MNSNTHATSGQDTNYFMDLLRSKERFGAFKTCREDHHYSRETFAGLAKVSEKTVQRLEAGEPVLAESLERCINVYEDQQTRDLLRFFANPGEKFFQDAQRNINEFNKVAEVSEPRPIKRVKSHWDLGKALRGSLMLYYFEQLFEGPSDDIKRVILELKDNLQDILDLSSDISEKEFYECLEPCFETITTLKAANVQVHCSQVPYVDNHKNGNGKILEISVLCFSYGDFEEIHAMVPKKTMLGDLQKL